MIRRSAMYSPCNEASTSLFHVKSGGLGEGYSCLAVTSLLHLVHVICINVLFGGHTITTCSSCYLPLKMLKKMLPNPCEEVCSGVAE